MFWVIPYLDVIRRSFTSAISGKFTGFDNYRTVLGNTAFRLAAGNTARFFGICIPLLVVLSVLNGFKVFREAYLVAGDYPQEKMYLLQHLFNNWYRDLSLDKMSAAAVLTGLVIFGLIRILEKAWEGEG